MHGDSTKTASKKLPAGNIAKYYLLTLALLLLRQKGSDASLVQKQGKKNIMKPMFSCTTYRVV